MIILCVCFKCIFYTQRHSNKDNQNNISNYQIIKCVVIQISTWFIYHLFEGISHITVLPVNFFSGPVYWSPKKTGPPCKNILWDITINAHSSSHLLRIFFFFNSELALSGFKFHSALRWLAFLWLIQTGWEDYSFIPHAQLAAGCAGSAGCNAIISFPKLLRRVMNALMFCRWTLQIKFFLFF